MTRPVPGARVANRYRCWHVATIITELGVGHYCFIGIIESDADPAPDCLLIDNVSEFHELH
jgi:hypothetical protein